MHKQKQEIQNDAKILRHTIHLFCLKRLAVLQLMFYKFHFI